MGHTRQTLLGRVHAWVEADLRGDAEALVTFLDPRLRPDAAGNRDAELVRVPRAMRRPTGPVDDAESEKIESQGVEKVEILEASKRSQQHAGRAAALVRTVLRSDRSATGDATHTIWVRDDGVWYLSDRGAESWSSG